MKKSESKSKTLFRKKKRKGRLIIISAPSGCGKTTVVRTLMASLSQLKQSVSYTTRKPRPGEKHGRHYYFVPRADFLKKRKGGFFLEWARVFGQFYGTSNAICRQWISQGRDVVLTVDVQGMQQVKRKRGGTFLVSIFLMPPSMDELKRRLTRRGTDDPAQVQKRLAIAKSEMKSRSKYKHVIVNHNVPETVREIKRILRYEK